MDSIGIKHELDKDEEVVIANETPALLEIVQEGLFSRKSLLTDITGINEIESVYAMPLSYKQAYFAMAFNNKQKSWAHRKMVGNAYRFYKRCKI